MLPAPCSSAFSIQVGEIKDNWLRLSFVLFCGYSYSARRATPNGELVE
ncbi:hypothetical protein FDUTEX481_00218 [Tolypothrix sp. PCC 7601]|nr:hypothetical protein FDUTEX481_00218 [Tolypothrix sp. PCC 7601]